jgi:hypothetical protein
MPNYCWLNIRTALPIVQSLPISYAVLTGTGNMPKIRWGKPKNAK